MIILYKEVNIMKKMSSFALILCFICLVPALSFAGTINSSGGVGTSDIIQQFKTSKNVTIECTATATDYYANSGHLNGDKQYGTISGDSVFYVSTKTPGTAITAADSAAITGWSQL